MDANTDQPKPGADSSGAAVWDLILLDPGLPEWLRADVEARDRLGAERYGQRLRVHNGRDALLDSYQEALDLWVYLSQSLLRAQHAMSADEATAVFARALALKVHSVRELVIWLGQLVHTGVGRELT